MGKKIRFGNQVLPMPARKFLALAFPGRPAKASGMKPAILYVDDDSAMLEIFATYCRDQGCEVVAVASGQQAMSQANAQRFSLAAFDIHLARENGMELLSRFKPGFPPCPS